MSVINLQAVRERFERKYIGELGYGSGREFTTQLLASVGSGDLFMDAGCGEGGLRHLLSREVYYIGLDRYTGQQHNEYDTWNMKPDLLGDVHQLPLAPCIFKTVALLHVLEHLREPRLALLEIFRVLRPGGYLFVDVPFIHQIHHPPHDYYRYTPYSLTDLVEAVGLEVVEIRPSGGYFRVLSHILSEAPNIVSGKGVGSGLVRLMLALPLSGLGWLLGKLQYFLDLEDRSQQFTCGYHCVFRKPSSASSGSQ